MYKYTKKLHKKRVILVPQRIIKNFLILTIAIVVLLFLVYPSNATNIPKYEKIPVTKNATLWSIAKEYMPDTEVREAVHILREVNGLESAMIRRGDTLLVPKEE